MSNIHRDASFIFNLMGLFVWIPDMIGYVRYARLNIFSKVCVDLLEH